MMPEGVESIHRVFILQSYLWHEERIVGLVVFCQPRLDALVVDIHPQHIDRWSPTMPQVNKMSQRTARRILPRLPVAAVESHINVHWQIVDFTSRLGYLLHIGGVGPRLEDLLRIDVIPKQLRPVGTRFSLRLQFLFQIRVQRLLMPLQIVGQLLGHSALVQPRRIRRIVARHLNHTDLILHLHHDHRLLQSIMIT